MKQIVYFFALITLSLVFITCDDNDDTSVDPAGTVTVTLKGLDPSGEGHAVIAFEYPSDMKTYRSNEFIAIEPVEPNGYGNLYVSAKNHFNLIATESAAIYVLDDPIGRLNDISSLPTEDLNDYSKYWRIFFEEKTGLIIRFKSGDEYINVRLFIDKIVDSDDDDEYKVTIKYQYPFIP